MKLLVGIGEVRFSNSVLDEIVVISLASCVAVTLYCPEKKAGSMIHIALPNLGERRISDFEDGYFAVPGLANMVKKFSQLYKPNLNILQVKVFGGAKPTKSTDSFKIGDKNLSAVYKVLDDLQLNYDKTNVGGFISRTVKLHIRTGDIDIKTSKIII